MKSWIALHRSDEAEKLQADHPNAFLLLCQIARRARWEPCRIHGLEKGQAFIGDYRKAGLSSPRAYRNAKNTLLRTGLATFKGTNKGTVATLLPNGVFSLSLFEGDNLEDKPKDNRQTNDRQLTTKNRKISREKREKPPAEFDNRESSDIDQDQPLRDKTNALRMGWQASPVFSPDEETQFQNNKAALAALTDETWEAMAAYIIAKFPEGTGEWQPRQRIMFLKRPGDLAAPAVSWHHKRPTPKPKIKEPEANSEDTASQEDIAEFFKKTLSFRN